MGLIDLLFRSAVALTRSATCVDETCMTTQGPVLPMTRVGILAKSNLRAAIPHLVDIEAWLARRGIEAVFETETGGLMPPAPRRAAADKAALASTVCMVVVLG